MASRNFGSGRQSSRESKYADERSGSKTGGRAAPKSTSHNFGSPGPSYSRSNGAGGTTSSRAAKGNDGVQDFERHQESSRGGGSNGQKSVEMQHQHQLGQRQSSKGNGEKPVFNPPKHFVFVDMHEQYRRWQIERGDPYYGILDEANYDPEEDVYYDVNNALPKWL